MKNVTSRDPRKAAIVEAFKQLYGASKVTLLKERKDGSFQAHCLKTDTQRGRPGWRPGFLTMGDKALRFDGACNAESVSGLPVEVAP